MKKPLLLLLGGILCAFSAMGQSSCSQVLRSARALYDEGDLYLLPETLETCLEEGFTKEEKIEAYRLLSLSYLFREEQTKAEQSFLKLLEINPEYEVNEEAEPAELVILANKFDTDPKFFFGFHYGQLYNIIEVTEVNHTFPESQPGTYPFSLSFQAGVFFKVPISKQFFASAEFNFTNKVYSLDVPSLTSGQDDEQLEGNANYLETRQSFELPVLGHYKLPFEGINAEVVAGPSLHYLVTATLSNSGEIEGGSDFNDSGIDVIPYRNQLNVGGMAGLESSFKWLGRNFVRFGLYYQYRFLEEVYQPEKLGADQLKRILENGNAENQYKLHAVIFKVGITLPYYNPKLK